MAFTIRQGHPFPRDVVPGGTASFTIDVDSDVPISGQQEWIAVRFPEGTTFPDPDGEVRYIANNETINEALSSRWDPVNRLLRFRSTLHLNDGSPRQNGFYSINIQALVDAEPGIHRENDAMEIGGVKAALSIDIVDPNQGPNSAVVRRPADRTYWAWGAARWEAAGAGAWSLPGAVIPLTIGGASANGAIFAATFSAEALSTAPDNNSVMWLDVLFGGLAPQPVGGNQRFTSAAKDREWSSHTVQRVIKFLPQSNLQDVTAKVHVSHGGIDGSKCGLQNWVLKIERYNL
ncbi:hypothetical protein [Streptomyces sp. NPDC050485]|uniref:hypothetical protein n=1 Tax=Streptomyces sp. NPDC050485 TaxID=3365617 RepID=UPI0037A35F5F